jgi:hypothetical protein
MEPIVGRETLFEGLNAEERRRLYFLLLVIDQLEPREALALAERIEAFITAGNPPPFDISEPQTPASPTASCSDAGSGNGDQHAISAGNVPPSFHELAQASSTSPRRRLDRPLQIEFFKAVARGATNGELAERFGLTKRQAQAFRIGIARRSRATGLTNGRRGQSLASMELPSMKVARPKSPPNSAEEEVVRFLRQIGDVVVKVDDIFVVNSILRLNFQELVARANTKRLQRGKSTFEFPQAHTAGIVSASDDNGVSDRA